MSVFASAPRPIHFDLPPQMFWLVWVGFLGLIVLMLVAAFRAARKRTEALQQFALEHGFQFSATQDEAPAADLAAIHLGGVGFDANPTYRNMLRGSTGGLDTVIADRTVGSGKNRSTSTIVAFKLARTLPDFVLYPESGLFRLVEKLGYSDIDFEGAPDFSRRFFLHGKDVDAVRAVFTPAVTSAFEQLDAKASFAAAGSGPWLVFYRGGRLIPTQQLPTFLQQVEPLAGAFRRLQVSGAF